MVIQEFGLILTENKFQDFKQRKPLKYFYFSIQYWFSVVSFDFQYSVFCIQYSVLSSVFRCGFIFICNISGSYITSTKSLNKTLCQMKSQNINFRKWECNISTSVHFVLKRLLFWKRQNQHLPLLGIFCFVLLWFFKFLWKDNFWWNFNCLSNGWFNSHLN